MRTVKQLHPVMTCLIPCILLLNGCASEAQRSLPSTAPAVQLAVTDMRLIKPGVSVGALRLGDTRERALEMFPKKPNYDEEYNYDGRFTPCVYTEIHWLDFDHLDRWGIFIYLKEGRIYQIKADTPRYATVEGITSDSSPEDVRSHYPKLQAYVLLHSGAKVNGGRDLIYWVDRQQGITFEFYYDGRVDARRVASINIFEPGTEFLPNGCISPPREWHRLEPFALEPPSNESQNVKR